jgi:tetratricopeptide (TPR) repeat protein
METIPLGNLRPEYQRALDGLAPGETSQPVAVSNAFAILHVTLDAEERWMRQRAAGIAAFQSGDDAGAEAGLAQAVDDAEAIGPGDLRLAHSLGELAGFYRLQDRSADAEALFRRGLEIQEARLGRNHPAVGETLNNLAEVHRIDGRFDDAEPLYHRSLAILEQSLGREHPTVGISLNNLALFYQDQELYARAQPLLLQSLAIMERNAGPNDIALAATLANLGRVYHVQSNYAAAESSYRRALALLEPVVGTGDPNYVEIRRRLNAAMRRQPSPEDEGILQAPVQQ